MIQRRLYKASCSVLCAQDTSVTTRMKHCMGIVRTGSSVYGNGVGAYHSVFDENPEKHTPPLFCIEVAHKERMGVYPCTLRYMKLLLSRV